MADSGPSGRLEGKVAIVTGGGSGARGQVVEPDAAARAILDGVQRNQALIIFPSSIRLVRRLAGLFPRLIDRTQVRQVRNGRQHHTGAAQTSSGLTVIRVWALTESSLPWAIRHR